MGKAIIAGLATLVVLIGSSLPLVAPPPPAWAASPPASPAQAASSATYVVRQGDYLYDVAHRFGTTVRAIAQSNNLANPDLIYPGQTLMLPAAGQSASPSSAVAGSAIAVDRVADPAPLAAAAPVPESQPGVAAIAMTEREAALLAAVNARRAAAGLNKLRFEPALVPVALARSNDMASRNYFSHTTPEGGTVQDLVRAAGLRYTWANEILARNNYPDGQSVEVSISAFMQSDPHRGHILSPVYYRAAVGEARTPDGMHYFTVMLASEQ